VGQQSALGNSTVVTVTLCVCGCVCGCGGVSLVWLTIQDEEDKAPIITGVHISHT